MISFIKIETASLIFACLSVVTSFAGFIWYGRAVVRVCISLTNLIEPSEKSPYYIQERIRYYGLFSNITISILLTILIVALVFSIILTKGLISKNSHLVKAYFIYGVTWNTVALLFALYLVLVISVNVGLYIFLGCFVYCLILMMIKKTYLKLAAGEHDKCCPKNVLEEETISIKL